MMNVDLQQLIRTLTAQMRADLKRSAQRCVERGGREVLVEDLLLALLEQPAGLLAKALADAEVAADELQAILQPGSEQGATRHPVFAPALVRWLQQASVVAHVELGQRLVDHGALLLALLRHPLEYAGSAVQPVLGRLDAGRLRDFLINRPAGPGPVLTESLMTELAEGRRQHGALNRDADSGLLVDTQALQEVNLRLENIEREHQSSARRWDQQRGQLSKKPQVCPHQVAQVISALTGIPVEQLALEPNEKVLGFADALCTRILGQEPAVQALDRALRAHFKPALLARMRVVPYYPITGQVLHDVSRLKLSSVARRLHARKLGFTYTPELPAHIAEHCADGGSSARYIDQWIERPLLPPIVDGLLSAMASDQPLSRVHVRLDGNGRPACEYSQ